MEDTSSEGADSSISVRMGLHERPKVTSLVPLGIQHVLAMFAGTVGVPLVLARSIGLGAQETAFIVGMTLVVSGIATLVQSYPVGPVGARLPIVMGATFVFLPAMISTGNRFGLDAIFGAAIVASVVEIVIGRFYDQLQRWFPSLVTGIVVLLIGLSLIPVAIDFAAGGSDAADYGAVVHLTLAGVVFLTAIVLNQFFEGFFSAASILIGIVVGYAVSVPLGIVDFSRVAAAGWFQFPIPFKYGVEFRIDVILTFAFLYVITAMETIGDITGTTAMIGREPETEEMRGGLMADGFMSAFAAVFNTFPNTSYSQNVGVVGFTGVASRYVTAVGGVVLVLMGLSPKIGAIANAMPNAVLGGALIVVFGMIFSAGVSIIAQNVDLNQRNLTILAVSVGLGLGLELRPDALSELPENLQLFLGSGILVGGLLAVLLNAVFPEQSDKVTLARVVEGIR